VFSVDSTLLHYSNSAIRECHNGASDAAVRVRLSKTTRLHCVSTVRKKHSSHAVSQENMMAATTWLAH
jgi:hypothetical protein